MMPDPDPVRDLRRSADDFEEAARVASNTAAAARIRADEAQADADRSTALAETYRDAADKLERSLAAKLLATDDASAR